MTTKLSNKEFWLAVRDGRKDFSNCDLSEVISLTATWDNDLHIGQNLWKMSWTGFNFSGASFRTGEGWCRGLDVMSANLKGANFRGIQAGSFKAGYANFEGCNFQEADLNWGWFCLANLSQTNLQCANLFQADLVGAKLINAKLNSAMLARATIDASCNLTGADLSNVTLIQSAFSPLRTKGLNLSNADMRGCYLSSGYFAGVSFRGADLRGANFRNANVCGADFTGATFDTATIFDGAYANDKTVWPAFRFQAWQALKPLWQLRTWTTQDEQYRLEQIKADERDWEKHWK